ncbi:MAG: MauE/DoxX family redox-associated membrane protein [Planctomycetota bacterium]
MMIKTSAIMRFDRQKREKFFSALFYVLRIGIGCMFIWGSLPKIRQPYDFLSSVYSYELVGSRLGMFIAMTLPWLELMVGICLIGGIFVSGALLASMGMAAMFTFVLASALYQGLEITCGCFGTGATEIITYKTLIRAIIILSAGFSAYLCAIFRPQTEIALN